MWDNGSTVDAGAVTFGSGTTGITGAVSDTNSLVGSTANDSVGLYGISALTNGNYVVNSADWDNGSTVDAGAVTFGSGTTGITGAISATNSLVGSTANDRVGAQGVVALRNGNYVVRSTMWDNGSTVNAGAVTFGSGITGITGAVSVTNSLVGSTANDRVGTHLAALRNGNYAVISAMWDNGSTVDAGAVTLGNGITGITGAVSDTNSLVGSTANDRVGAQGILALRNGNYVVRSAMWDNGSTVDAGAVTFGNGTTGITGAVSATNSLVGSTANDSVGTQYILALRNGNYVVRSAMWDNGSTVDAGAVTFGSGTTGITGAVSATNSLVGTTANDRVGSYGILELTNGNYVVKSATWDNGSTVDAGAATWANGSTGKTRDGKNTINAQNSIIGVNTSTKRMSVIEESVNATFITRFVGQSTSRITVGLGDPSQASFSRLIESNRSNSSANISGSSTSSANISGASTPSNSSPTGIGGVTLENPTSNPGSDRSGLGGVSTTSNSNASPTSSSRSETFTPPGQANRATQGNSGSNDSNSSANISGASTTNISEANTANISGASTPSS